MPYSPFLNVSFRSSSLSIGLFSRLITPQKLDPIFYSKFNTKLELQFQRVKSAQISFSLAPRLSREE